jgi:uncharacterized protein YecA (UPF0149 family)
MAQVIWILETLQHLGVNSLQEQPDHVRLRLSAMIIHELCQMRMRRYSSVLALLAAFPVLAVSQSRADAAELLKRVVANLTAHDLKSRSYSFTEDYRNSNHSKKLKIDIDETARYETVFIEGTPYRRKIQENGKPLTGRASDEEEKKYQATVAERRRINDELKQTPFHSEYRMPSAYEEWPNLFVARIQGEETIDGRQIYRMVLTPRPAITPESDAQKDALQTSIQLWIDRADELPVHIKREYLRDGVYMLRGGAIELFWQKEPQSGTYLLNHIYTRYRVNFLGTVVSGEADQEFSNYKRFGVDVKVTTEPDQR